MKIVIIEDESASQQYLKKLLEKEFPQLAIAAIADNVPDAVDAIKNNMPEIIFMDIDIRMGTAFDVLAALPDIRAGIIFTTAFNQYAIDAFRYHAVDYLLKPLEDALVISAVKHCLERIEQKSNSRQITQLLQFFRQSEQPKARISVHTMEGIEFVDTEEIFFAEAKGNYTELKLRGGARIVASKKLKEMEQVLGEPLFFRIHHSYIVNTRYVKKYYKGRGGYVILTDETSLPVSSARKDDFLKHFGQE